MTSGFPVDAGDGRDAAPDEAGDGHRVLEGFDQSLVVKQVDARQSEWDRRALPVVRN